MQILSARVESFLRRSGSNTVAAVYDRPTARPNKVACPENAPFGGHRPPLQKIAVNLITRFDPLESATAGASVSPRCRS